MAGCVFDTSDRVQHMFFRQMSQGQAEFGGAIEEMYRRMDAVVGQTLRHVDSRTLLLVLSDHGFRAFNRGVNTNAWLREHGYLNLNRVGQALPPVGLGDKYFQGVDWKTTRAYALGLGGIYLNLRGREPEGIVEPGDEARALKAELIGSRYVARWPWSNCNNRKMRSAAPTFQSTRPDTIDSLAG